MLKHSEGNTGIGRALAAAALALGVSLAAASCAKGAAGTGSEPGTGTQGGNGPDGSTVACPTCDSDGDGVPDGSDACPGTPGGAVVNHAGCAESQLTPQLQPAFPPYGLAWTPAGDLGRAGGLTWVYTGIDRGDLFHIYWVVCDDPATPCGLSLDGPISTAAEGWTLSAADSDFSNGKAVFTNQTSMLLADASTPSLVGRLTVTITDGSGTAIPFADPTTLGVPARFGKVGAEIKGTAFKVVALIEVQDPATAAWTPYLDYYDAAGTPEGPDSGSGPATVSFGGSFYDE